MKQQSGFTLIELSIVLVIIGLIVGGVLIGRDLIKSSEIRATIGQIEKYNAAVNTFRGKYNGLPGDMDGTNFGLNAVGGTGNNNGLIQNNGSNPYFLLSGESLVFWVHLAQANLISDPVDLTRSYAAADVSTPDRTVLPESKLSGDTWIMISSTNGLNYFGISGYAGQVNTLTITPVEAYQIDSKIDNGVPDNGTVLSVIGSAGTIATPGRGAADNTLCYNATTTPGVYATVASPQTPQCVLSIRASF